MKTMKLVSSLLTLKHPKFARNIKLLNGTILRTKSGKALSRLLKFIQVFIRLTSRLNLLEDKNMKLYAS